MKLTAISVMGVLLGPALGAERELGRATPLGDYGYGMAMDLSGDTAVIGNRLEAVDVGDVERRTVDVLRRNTATGSWERVATLAAPTGQHFFGWSVAIDGDVAAVGAPAAVRPDQRLDGGLALAGVVYVYGRNQGGTNRWGLQRTIIGDFQETGAHLSLSGATLAIGSPAIVSDRVGRISLHERNQGGAGSWGRSANLDLPEVGTSPGGQERRFGTNFDLEGNLLAVGSHDDFEESHTVRIHGRNEGGANAWGTAAILRPLPGVSEFGQRLALDGGRLVVTGKMDNGPYFYRLYWRDGSGSFITGNSINTSDNPRRVALRDNLLAVIDRLENGQVRVRVSHWAEGDHLTDLRARLLGMQDTEGHGYRYGIAVSSNSILAGVDRESEGVESHGAGVVVPLERNQGGTNQFGDWPVISPQMVGGGGGFGSVMAMAGRYLVVGDPNRAAGGVNRGMVSIFHRRSDGYASSGESWKMIARIGRPTGRDETRFGAAVAVIEDGSVLIGAPGDEGGGSAYLYRMDVMGRPVLAHTFNTGNAAGNPQYGSAVAIYSRDEVFVGAPGADISGTNSGMVYRYRETGTGWNFSQMPRSDGDGSPQGDAYGNALAVDRNTLVVGAWQDENNGSVYVFERVGTNWPSSRKLYPSVTNRGYFGHSVAISGDRLVVGVLGLAVFIPIQGDAFVFERTGSGWVESRQLNPGGLDNGDSMGNSVAIGSDYLLSGAPGDDGTAEAPSQDRGVVYRYDRSGSGWATGTRITPDWRTPDGMGVNTGLQMQRFGTGVAANRDWFAVGAPRHGAVGTLSGMVRFYRIGAYERWAGPRELPFGADGFHDDPDGDGQSNLLEFSLGSEPLDGGSMGGIEFSFIDRPASGGLPAGRYLNGRVEKPSHLAGSSLVLHQFEAGSHPANLAAAHVLHHESTATRLQGIYRSPVQAEPKGFMRLRVDWIGD